jgi:transposase
MQDGTRFVGLDVSRREIAVAVAAGSGGEPESFGKIANTPEAITLLVRALRRGGKHLVCCYEAGAGGLVLYRQLTSFADVECLVAAPSLIPRAPGERVKTDRRDALKLARLLRSGDLVPAYTPCEEEETLRDITRMREWAVFDASRAKNRLGKLLLRWGIEPPPTFKKRWTKQYWNWLRTLRFDDLRQPIFTEHVYAVVAGDERVRRCEELVKRAAAQSQYADLIKVLQVFRGVAGITATSLVAEMGDFGRFPAARFAMGYSGLTAREHSSGPRVRRGSITRVGNAHLRYLLVETAWHYLHEPRPSKALAARRRHLPGEYVAIAEQAEQRLHRRFRRLVHHNNKLKTVAAVAVGRELIGFIWALAYAYRTREAA